MLAPRSQAVADGGNCLALIWRTLRVFPTTRTLGHTGIVVSHVCFERALYSAMARQVKQAYASRYETAGRDSDGAGRAASWELLGWVLAAGRARHDTHSALRRARVRALVH